MSHRRKNSHSVVAITKMTLTKDRRTLARLSDPYEGSLRTPPLIFYQCRHKSVKFKALWDSLFMSNKFISKVIEAEVRNHTKINK